MPLVKARGNMYDWIDYTHCHLGGQCPHSCSYCYVDHFPYGRPARYQGDLRLIEKEFKVRYDKETLTKNGGAYPGVIFIENCNDMFAKGVPRGYQDIILSHCSIFPENDYVFQTKNPGGYVTMDSLFPEKSLFGCTIETNRHYPDVMKNAPEPKSRLFGMIDLPTHAKTFVTIEPILDFDLDEFMNMITAIWPDFVNIGADSKKHNLPEPSADKIKALISEIQNAGIEIREKHNLERLLK